MSSGGCDFRERLVKLFFLIFRCTGLGIVQLFSDRKNGKWEGFTLSRGWNGLSFRVKLWMNTPLFEIGSNVLGFTTVKATIKILTGSINFYGLTTLVQI